MNVEELKVLRFPLLVLVAVLACAAGAVYYTHLLLQKTQGALVRQTSQLREAQSRMRQSGDEKIVIEKYVGGYRQLQQLGFIGDEQRINWLDALRKSNERADLFGVNYEIGVQQAYAYAAELDRGKMALHQSVMRAELRVLHELDLLKFIHALLAQNAGLFHLDQCLLRRTDVSGAIRNQPNVTATCQLAWITATPEAQSEGQRP